MLEIVSISFIFLVVIYYLLTKDIFHPSVIVSGFWALLVSLYAFTEHPLWDLSNKFCLAISLWVFPFTIFAFICSRKYKSSQLSYPSNSKLSFNVGMFDRLYPFVILYNIVFLLLIVYYAGGLSFPAIRSFLVNQKFPPLLNMLFYLNTFLTVYVFYALLNLNTLNKNKVLILFFLLLITSVFKSNKTSFLMLFVSVLFILHVIKKLKFIHILYALIILVGLLTFVTLNRGDYDFESEGGLLNYLYIYILSPLTAFDALLNKEVTLDPGTWGSGTFAFLYKILNIFSANLDLAELGTWIYVPLPTNVYTTMRGFYLDGGYMGIFLMACLLGMIWGFMYMRQASGDKIYTLFYALMIGSLFFQSFGDYFFYSFSTTLQYYIFSVLITHGIIFNRK